MISSSLKKSLKIFLTGVFSCRPHFYPRGRGNFINPITDVIWGCLFPIHVAGVNATPDHKDFVNYSYKDKFCACVGAPPKVGVPLAFWEPTALIDVTENTV